MPTADSRFFASPEHAVTTIRELLIKGDYKTLADYCHVSGVSRRALLKGVWFRRRDEDQMPMWLGDHVRPFPPAFRYLHHEIQGQTTKVVTGINIDQGGGMTLEGQAVFWLIFAEGGYQLLTTENPS